MDNKANQKVKRGEIYLHDFGVNEGSIQNGVRPVLVVQCDEGNMASTTTVVAAMTSVIKKRYLPSHIILGDSFGLKEPSMVMFDPLPEEYFDKRTGKMKKRTNKYYPDEIRMKLGRSYSDYMATQERSSFESLSGYLDSQGDNVESTVSDEAAASISIQEQEKKRTSLFGSIIGRGGDDSGRNYGG